MQMIILLHEQHVGDTKYNQCADKIEPMCKRRVRNQEDKAEGDDQLNSHINH